MSPHVDNYDIADKAAEMTEVLYRRFGADIRHQAGRTWMLTCLAEVLAKDHPNRTREIIAGAPHPCDGLDYMEQQAGDLSRALDRAHTILSNMAAEHTTGWRGIFARWPIHHEPLRNDAQRALPQIRAALGYDDSPSLSPQEAEAPTTQQGGE